jgi:hypothetical protein
MGSGGSQSSSLSPIVNASQDDVSPPPPLQPPRTAKRPSLITHPRQPKRATLIAGCPRRRGEMGGGTKVLGEGCRAGRHGSASTVRYNLRHRREKRSAELDHRREVVAQGSRSRTDEFVVGHGTVLPLRARRGPRRCTGDGVVQKGRGARKSCGCSSCAAVGYPGRGNEASD